MARCMIFVANVNVNSGGELEVRVYRFEHSNVWNADNRNRVVVLKPAASPTSYRVGVLFSSPFLQPPSMRPISSSFPEIEIYFLESSSFVSQASWRKNFRRSSFVIDFLRKVNFSLVGK